MATDGYDLRLRGTKAGSSSHALAIDRFSAGKYGLESRESDQENSCCSGCFTGAFRAVGAAFSALGSLAYRQSARELELADAEFARRMEQEEQDAEFARRMEQEEQDADLAREIEQGQKRPRSHESFRASSSSNSSSSSAAAEASFCPVTSISDLERTRKLEALYARGLFTGPRLNRMYDLITCGIGSGIQNMMNSCTIASLIYAMFAATNFFDRLLLVGPETKDPLICKIRKTLIDIANGLRSKEGFVPGKLLDKLRILVLGISDGRFLQPDEFLHRLLEILGLMDLIGRSDVFTNLQIPPDRFYSHEREVEQSPTLGLILDREKDLRVVQQREISRRLGPGRNDAPPIISGSNNKVMFIQAPRHGTGYEAVRPYEAIIPSLRIDVEGQRYRLVSILANENFNHYVSYVINPNERNQNKLCYFNGGGLGTPKVVGLKDLYEVLFEARDIESTDSNIQAWYRKICKEASFFIYVREE